MDIGQYTYFGTENNAENIINLTDNSQIDQLCKNYNSNFFILGGGSNVLLTKKDYEDCLFVRNLLKGIEYLGYGYVKVQSGESLIRLVQRVKDSFNSNVLNPVYGLPGTVGGAVIGNAGSFGVEMGKYVHTIKYIDETGTIVENRNYTCEYRNSNLKGRKIVLLEIVFQFDFDTNYCCENTDYYMNWRLKNHECSKTCGSYFKSNILDVQKDSESINKILKIKDNVIEKFNPNGLEGVDSVKIPVGWLIDMCGLRGFSQNGVKISEKHGNFIVNYDNKDSNNILNIANLAKEKVYDKFGIIIEEEVVII
ncbi:MAG: UDP-N-acetylmuramate dehydrogenase [Candidatus Absconditabacteria bacterium]